jgi:hypothetical protein
MVIGGSAIRFRFGHWSTDNLDLLIDPTMETAERGHDALQGANLDCST